ncbi:MAG: ATP-binding protein [Solirubrobacterales bacterium]
MGVVLTLAGAFVYLRVGSDIQDSIDEGLQSRVDDISQRLLVAGPDELGLGVARGEGGEDFLTQIVDPNGRVLGSTAGETGASVLDPQQLRTALREPTYFDQGDVPGVEDSARILAAPVDGRDGTALVVVGVSTGDRAETLSGLAKALIIGGPLALLISSGLGYGLATLGMRPVESMRSRAGQITLEHSGERLPLPRSEDEITRLGRTLNEMLDRLEVSIERERTFVADAGHELRTPLAVLRGELELALRPGRNEADRLQAMRSAIDECDRLQHLANALMALASSDGERIPLERAQANLSELLDGTRARLLRRAEANGREIAVKAPHDLHWSLDGKRVESAVENLIENSLKYGEGTIEITAGVTDGELAIAVSDEGPGFSEDFRARAFDRFARADASRTTDGSGLGLAIVRAVAEAHGGGAAIVDRRRGAMVEMRIPGRGGQDSELPQHPA